jgi:hypothetical protein
MFVQVTELLPCFQVVYTGEEKKSGCNVETGKINDKHGEQIK